MLSSILAFIIAIALPIHVGAQSDVIRMSPVISLCRTAGQFAMTFDGGPSIYTGDVLDAFDSRKLKATFHPVVSYLDNVAIVANLQRAASSGHLIGLSMEASLNLSGMNDSALLDAIDVRAQAVQYYTGSKPRFLRIPNYSSLSMDQLNLISSHGYVITTYNIDSYDYTSSDSLQNFKKVLDVLSNNTKGAFISVQRDSVQSSVQQTGSIIDYILGKGYQIVTLDTCVAAPNLGGSGGGASGGGKGGSGSSGGGGSDISPMGGAGGKVVSSSTSNSATSDASSLSLHHQQAASKALLAMVMLASLFM